MANPNDLFALDDLHLVTRSPIIAAMADKDHLAAAIDRIYTVSTLETTLETTLDAATSDYDTTQDATIADMVGDDEGPVIGLVNALLEQAIADGASDLHVEPNDQNIAVRVRIDGVLHDISEIPLGVLRPLVSRLKILGDLDIAQNRIAQDGRFSLKIQGRPIDVRVVTIPTAAGEAVVLRLLDPVREALDVSSLGLTAEESARFLPAFRAPQGAVFITGPTGSGKTSTVYAVLSQINSREKSIVSVEDPVEYRLRGTKQIQINPRAGVDFPRALRSILRADPDVVLIGEVRDAETARIAADASITGHLVLSTLHTTRAAAAADAFGRHGCRAVSRGVGAHPRRRAAARPEALRELRRTGDRSRFRSAAQPRCDRRDARRGDPVPRGRLSELPEHRLPRAPAVVRDHAGE